MRLRYQRVTNWPIMETKGHKLSDPFIRISVEIAGTLRDSGFRKAGKTLVFENCSLNMLRYGIPRADGVCVPSPVPAGGDHVDGIHKTHEEWNEAGTFGLIVTLKKNERCEKTPQKDCAD